MMNWLRFGAVAIALSACQPAQSPEQTPALKPIPVSASAAPGTSMPSPKLAGEIFAKACINTSPSFRGTRSALMAYPFVQHKTFGTYYHKFENLSVKVFEGNCSLVFGSPVGPKAVIPELAKSASYTTSNLPPDIEITSSMRPDGLRYFRMKISRK